MRFDSQDDHLTVFSALRGTVAFIGDVVVANPGVAGGATALCVAMTFFTANAIWFQEQHHPAALFATRPELAVQAEAPGRNAGGSKARHPSASAADISRRISGEEAASGGARPAIPAIVPVPVPRPGSVGTADGQVSSDPLVAGAQDLLSKLGYYEGDVDGLRGPKTNAAIEAYKDKAGLHGIELSEAELITSLRNNLGVTAAIPEPRPEAQDRQAAEKLVEEIVARGAEPGALPLPSQIPSAEVVKVQAALRAFGNTDISVDGFAGEQTKMAIREFQALFRLPVTGEIDGNLLDKMRAVGLIQ